MAKYKELPAVLNMHDAIADDAPIIHKNLNDYIKIFDAISYGNVMSETKMSREM